MKILFWLSLIGTLYSYFLYPLLLSLWPRRKSVAPAPQTKEPVVSVIVTAHNEADRIGAKLENSLVLDYPRERMEILVASDASSDATDAIVCGYADRGVQLVRAEPRRGKEYAQSLAIAAARGDILVFTDVGTRIEPVGLRHIVTDFADPSVGAVSSEDRFITRDGTVVGEGAYVRYEMWLRRLESSVNSLIGLSGSFFAARRAVCATWDIASPSDFNTALNCARLGYVAIADPNLIGYYQDIQDERREYARKVRTVIRGIASLARHIEVLNPLRFGFFAFQVWSHKVMRWMVPWFLFALFVSSTALVWQHPFYLFVAVGQAAFYSLAIAAVFVAGVRRHALLKLPFFFVQVNAAIAQATILFLVGKRVKVWEPSKR